VWVEAAAQLLQRDEREAVLGDLAEAGEGTRQALFGVLGLAIRQQAGLWRSWRPWVAAFGLALPCSFLLMGSSLSVSWAFQHLLAMKSHNEPAMGSAFLTLAEDALMLAGCALAGGFAVGSLSRRTLWMSIASCFLPCLFCLERFRIESLSRLCLLLFLLPAVWGARQGLRMVRIPWSAAVGLALAVTLLAIPAWHGSQIYLVALLWPAWYVAATALTHSQQGLGQGNR
jgi:hypothetical protein